MYTHEQTIDMLCDGAMLICDDVVYRIDCVVIEDNKVYLTDEETGEDQTMNIDEINLNDPEVLLYKYVLMNG